MTLRHLLAGVLAAVAIAMLPLSAGATVTFDGTAGMDANIFSGGTYGGACTGCHFAGSGLAVFDSWANVNAYAGNGGGCAGAGVSGKACIVWRIVNSEMPSSGALTATGMSLATAWQSGGFARNASPQPTTGAASGIGLTGATLAGTVLENGSETTVQFRYGIDQVTVNNGTGGSTIAATSPTGTGGGTAAGAFSASPSGLTCGTTYYYRAEGDNAVSPAFVGGTTTSFSTLPCTSISTVAVTSATESLPYSYDVNATGGDGSYTFSLLNQPVGMSIVAGTGVISWTPPEALSNYSASNIQVTANDGASTDTQTFSITVSANNDAPTFSSSAVTTATEDTAYSYDVNASDVESQTMTYSLTTSPTGMSINASSGVISWTPTNAQAGLSHSVVVHASDGTNSQPQSFSVLVTAVNDAPTIDTVAVTTATEDVAYSYDVNASDIDSGTLTYSLTTWPAGMTIDGSTGVISWTPTNAQSGASHNVTVQVDDNSGAGNATVTQAFSIAVTAVNDPPAISSSPSTSGVEASLYSYQIVENDPDDSGAGLTYSLLTSPAGMTVSAGGLVQWTPPNGTTSANVTAQVADGGEDGALPVTQSWTITVGAVNDPPSITSTAGTAATEDTLYTYTATVSDIDDANNGTDLTWSLTTAPAGMTVSPTGAVSWTPTNAQAGTSHNVTLRVADGGENGALPDTESWTIVVTAVNDAPTIDTTAVTTATEDVAYSYDVNASDVDSSTLTYSLTTSPTGMSINPTTGVIAWTPTNAQAGASHNVTVQVNDNSGTGNATTTQSFSIAVTAVNDSPTIMTSPVVTATEDTAYSYGVLASDIDSSTLTFSLTTSPTGMTIDGTTGVISWTPTNAQAGAAHSVTVQVNDNSGAGNATVTQSFSIAVAAVNDPPVLAAISAQAVAELATLTVSAAVTDPDDANDGSGALTWTISSEDAPGTVSISNTGVLTYTPGENADGVYAVTVRVADGGENGALPATQTFALTVVRLDGDSDTVADYNDNCLVDANADQADNDHDGVGGGSGGTNGGNVCDSDDDNDGIPDAIELANGLDPFNATDAVGDLDGDGISNLAEFTACTALDTECLAIGQDSVAPLIFTNGDIEVTATGYYTAVPVSASATDLVFGLPVPVAARVDRQGPFRPGTHVLTWTASDGAIPMANVTTATQTITVVPTVTLGGTRIVGEGQTASVRVLLNGDSPQYPVDIAYTLGGTATADDIGAAATGTVSIASGTEGWITIPVVSDAVVEGTETLVVTLTGVTAGKAVLPTDASTTVAVVDTPMAPVVPSLWVEQGGEPRTVVYATGGPVTVSALASDPNGDALTYDWSTSNPVLGGVAAGTDLVVDPSYGIAAGSYDVVVRVSDGALVTEQRATIRIEAAAPVLTATDSDGDGVNDDVEGAADIDQDGLLDYLDPVDSQEMAALHIDNSAAGRLRVAVAQPGVALVAGGIAVAQQQGGIQVAASAIVDGYGVPVTDAGFIHVGAIYDFELRNVPANGVAAIVLPLPAALPPDAQWRKYINGAWFDFVEGANDALASSPAVDGACPAIDAAAWVDGLVAGNDCVRLTLSDGGPNDVDGVVNGAIRDPSGPAVATEAAPPTAPSGEKAGNGGLVFLVLLLLAGVRTQRRKD